MRVTMHRSIRLRVLFLFLHLWAVSSAVSQDATCHYPNGDVATGDFPCFLDQDQSPCCGSGTICEESGLCRVAGSIGVSDLIRGSCTDASWASSDCPIYCQGERPFAFALGYSYF